MGKEKKTTADDAFDWANRRLCPDESCIGIIGPDGRCTECGRQVDPEALDVAREDRQASDQSEGQSVGGPLENAGARASEEQAPTNDEWQSRRLCPDGNCIGVIGPDGRCKVCGLRAQEAP